MYNEGVSGVIVIVEKMDSATQVQILVKSVRVSLCGNAFGKDMYPSLPPPSQPWIK